jgi:hypothetical protein
MKYQLILQWSASSIKDYDGLIAVENKLTEKLSEDCEVDGHDFGTGEGNIFILTDHPEHTFNEAKVILDSGELSNARVAYRAIDKSHYTILWPQGLTVFRVA